MKYCVEFSKDDSSRVVCPSCGDDQIHHEAVTVFDRKEDAPTTATVIERVNRVSTIIGAQAECANPSPRRNGIAVRFWCETCDKVFEMTLAQHKGCTFLEWRIADQTAADVVRIYA